jgi:hypothetical protein
VVSKSQSAARAKKDQVPLGLGTLRNVGSSHRLAAPFAACAGACSLVGTQMDQADALSVSEGRTEAESEGTGRKPGAYVPRPTNPALVYPMFWMIACTRTASALRRGRGFPGLGWQ